MHFIQKALGIANMSTIVEVIERTEQDELVWEKVPNEKYTFYYETTSANADMELIMVSEQEALLLVEIEGLTIRLVIEVSACYELASIIEAKIKEADGRALLEALEQDAETINATYAPGQIVLVRNLDTDWLEATFVGVLVNRQVLVTDHTTGSLVIYRYIKNTEVQPITPKKLQLEEARAVLNNVPFDSTPIAKPVEVNIYSDTVIPTNYYEPLVTFDNSVYEEAPVIMPLAGSINNKEETMSRMEHALGLGIKITVEEEYQEPLGNVTFINPVTPTITDPAMIGTAIPNIVKKGIDIKAYMDDWFILAAHSRGEEEYYTPIFVDGPVRPHTPVSPYDYHARGQKVTIFPTWRYKGWIADTYRAYDHITLEAYCSQDGLHWYVDKLTKYADGPHGWKEALGYWGKKGDPLAHMPVPPEITPEYLEYKANMMDRENWVWTYRDWKEEWLAIENEATKERRQFFNHFTPSEWKLADPRPISHFMGELYAHEAAVVIFAEREKFNPKGSFRRNICSYKFTGRVLENGYMEIIKPDLVKGFSPKFHCTNLNHGSDVISKHLRTLQGQYFENFPQPYHPEDSKTIQDNQIREWNENRVDKLKQDYKQPTRPDNYFTNEEYRYAWKKYYKFNQYKDEQGIVHYDLIN